MVTMAHFGEQRDLLTWDKYDTDSLLDVDKLAALQHLIDLFTTSATVEDDGKRTVPRWQIPLSRIQSGA